MYRRIKHTGLLLLWLLVLVLLFVVVISRYRQRVREINKEMQKLIHADL